MDQYLALESLTLAELRNLMLKTRVRLSSVRTTVRLKKSTGETIFSTKGEATLVMPPADRADWHRRVRRNTEALTAMEEWVEVGDWGMAMSLWEQLGRGAPLASSMLRALGMTKESHEAKYYDLSTYLSLV